MRTFFDKNLLQITLGIQLYLVEIEKPRKQNVDDNDFSVKVVASLPVLHFETGVFERF